MKVRVEISELIWQNIGIRDYIEIIFVEFILHLYDVVTETIFASKFIRLREVIDLLVFIQSFVLAWFHALAGPKNVPIMSFSL